jgi:hypothetical protein
MEHIHFLNTFTESLYETIIKEKFNIKHTNGGFFLDKIYDKIFDNYFEKPIEFTIRCNISKRNSYDSAFSMPDYNNKIQIGLDISLLSDKNLLNDTINVLKSNKEDILDSLYHELYHLYDEKLGNSNSEKDFNNYLQSLSYDDNFEDLKYYFYKTQLYELRAETATTINRNKKEPGYISKSIFYEELKMIYNFKFDINDDTDFYDMVGSKLNMSGKGFLEFCFNRFKTRVETTISTFKNI